MHFSIKVYGTLNTFVSLSLFCWSPPPLPSNLGYFLSDISNIFSSSKYRFLAYNSSLDIKQMRVSKQITKKGQGVQHDD